MRCLKCGSEDNRVLESRLAPDGSNIRRRRECRNCLRRCTTFEREEELTFQIRKRDGQIEPYQRDKALRSMTIACQKRKIKPEELAFMIGQVENKIQESGEKIVCSQSLGNLILECLSHLDLVAYVRFASVYKDFKDLNEFQNILETLQLVGET